MTEQKVALVTGANKGIGFETVKQLAALGYFVFLVQGIKKMAQKQLKN